MKHKRIKFPDSFKSVVDEILSDSYSNLHTKEDFLGFFYYFDHSLAYSNNEWVQFAMHHIRGIFGRYNQSWKLPSIIKTLSEKNIIETKPYHFNILDKSKSITRKYRYTDEFLRKVIAEDINFSFGNISYKTYENLCKENIPIETHLLAQYNILRSDRFKIDIVKASQWLIDGLKNRTLSKGSYQVNMRVILSLDNKDNIYVKQDEKTGRVFTNFTCMKRELRQFCTIDNKPLKSLDLKAAQPTFLAHHLLSLYPQNQDVQRFYKVITESDIYNYLDKYMFHKELYTEFMPYDLRDQSKVEFMRWLFSSTRGMTEYDKAIKKEFPDVWKFVQEKKKEYKRNGTNYAIELQKMEAKIFIEGTVDLIQEGVLTVHDCIYFKEGLETQVEGSLVKSFKENKINKFNLT